MEQPGSPSERDPQVFHRTQRKQLRAIGAGRRLLDHAAGVLMALRVPLRDDVPLRTEDLRPRGEASFDSVPALVALQLHVDRWTANHEGGATVIDAVPNAWPARVAHLWLEGRLDIPCDRSGLDRLPEWAGNGEGRRRADALLADARAENPAGAIALAARRAGVGLVACFLPASADPAAVGLPSPEEVPPHVLPVLHAPSGSGSTDALRDLGWAVQDVPSGLAFEARLATALERAWHRDGGQPSLVLMRLPPALGQPPSLCGVDEWRPEDVEAWLRGYRIERILTHEGRLPADLRALVGGGRGPGEETKA